LEAIKDEPVLHAAVEVLIYADLAARKRCGSVECNARRLTPVEVVERGQIDLVWQVVEGLRSGSPLLGGACAFPYSDRIVS